MKRLLLEALRGLRQRAAGAAVAVLGLALALGAGLLVALLALALATPAPQIQDPARVVVLDFKGNPPGMPSPWFTRSPVAFAAMLRQGGAPLSGLGRAAPWWQDVSIQGISGPMALVLLDPHLQPLLGLRALHGDLAATLARRDAIALTPATVRKLWGDLPLAQALGRRVELEGRTLSVGAIVPERDPRDPLWAYEALAGFDSAANTMSEDDREALFLMNGRVFGRLLPGASAAQIGPLMRAAFLANPRYQQLPPDWRSGREAAFFRALPLTQLPFEGELNERRWQALAAMGAACGVLLVMAVLNLLNLLSAALLQRQRETALRRSLGANSIDLLRLWGTELTLVLLAGAGLAVLLAWWMAPLAAAALGLEASYPVADPMPPELWLGLALLLPPLGLLTLSAPAWQALRRVPAQALQGRTASEGPWGRRLRQGLLTLQLGGAVLLLALAGVLLAQQLHLLQADRGYQLENRLYLGLKVNPDRLPDLAPLIAALNSHPAVRHWAFSSMRPAQDMGQGGRELYVAAGGRQQVLRVDTVSASFFATYGIPVLAGQPVKAPPLADPMAEQPVVLDARAAQQLGFASPQAALGAQLHGGGGFLQAGEAPRRVVAVVGALKLESAREPAQPHAFVLSEQPQWDLTLQGDSVAALSAAVREIWARHGPPIQYELVPVDEQRARVFRQEQVLTGMLLAIALLAVGVAMLGGYALVADTLRRRRMELVLHRLHGAGDAALALQLAREFAWPLGLAALAGLPLAALLGRLYLQDFVDRADPLGGLGLPLLAALALTLLATRLAMLRHLRQALTLRPIEALR